MRTACSILAEAKVIRNMLFCVFILFKHGEVEAGCNPDGKTALARCTVGFNSLLSFQGLVENPGG